MKFKDIILTGVALTLLLTSCGGEGSADIAVTTDNTTDKTTVITTVTSEKPVVTTESTAEPFATEPPVSDADTAVTATEPPTTVTEPVVTTVVTTSVSIPVGTTTTTPPAPTEDGTTSNGYTVTVVDGITYVDGTLIANKTYPLPDTYNPGGLTPETYAAFLEMQAAASAEGLYIYVRSGYRSYIDQRIIYADYVARDGAAAADRYSARAGHSEHQSGMAIDVNETTYAFGESAEGIWLRENCHKYGFILRYPEEKEHITGYMYEPWHIRYVGVELAESVTASGLCLEEYFGITSSYAE